MAFDLDDDELKSTRKLLGIDKNKDARDTNVDSLEESIKRCKELIKPKNSEWIGLSNQNAIEIVLGNLEVLLDMRESADRELGRQKQINEEHQKENGLLRERVKELEAKLEFKQYGDLDDLRFEEYMNEFIPKQKIKDLKENIILQPVIVGGRRNGKTLEYGIKLGKIKACEELLQESEDK